MNNSDPIMKAKQFRHKMIKEVVLTERVHSQGDLARLLAERGLHVTQATLSRDLKYLRINKIAAHDGGYTYAVPSAATVADIYASQHKNHRIDLLSLEFSGNIVVIKTRNGYATGLAYDIDMNHLDQFVGTIAGADTVFCVLREGVTRAKALAALQQVINPPKEADEV